MSDSPQPGQMVLYDYIQPALPDGSYRVVVTTDVAGQTAPDELQDTRYFDVVGPRFSMAPTDVAGVYPPRNGHGDFSDSLPMIVLYRRTLPWERMSNLTAVPSAARPNQAPALTGPIPWVALLLLEDTDHYAFHPNVSLDAAVPPDVFAALGSPQGVTCDAVEVEDSLLHSILPTVEELRLLAHARQVNTDDRELSAGSSDGWFSVVVSNRLPSVHSRCRACLVSLEQRNDIVYADAPPTQTGRFPVRPPLGGATPTTSPEPIARAGGHSAEPIVRPGQSPADTSGAPGALHDAGAAGGGGNRGAAVAPSVGAAPGDLAGAGSAFLVGPEALRPDLHLPHPLPPLVLRSLVALHSWQFTNNGTGTFGEYMTNLDSGMIGRVAVPGKPVVADTGHLRVTVHTRAGAEEAAWYRGPLAPFALTRDPLGPYHSADQALRVTPDTGAEDVSYAAAFEVGRLLAAADVRLAQELMRWRRSGYAASLRLAVIARLQAILPLELPPTLRDQLAAALIPTLATAALGRVARGMGPGGDPYGLRIVSHAIGFNPQALARAWGIGASEAAALLGAGAGAIGAPVTVAPYAAPGTADIGAVVSDVAARQRLAAARSQLVQNLVLRQEG
jgi:hypothetical protein